MKDSDPRKDSVDRAVPDRSFPDRDFPAVHGSDRAHCSGTPYCSDTDWNRCGYCRNRTGKNDLSFPHTACWNNDSVNGLKSSVSPRNSRRCCCSMDCLRCRNPHFLPATWDLPSCRLCPRPPMCRCPKIRPRCRKSFRSPCFPLQHYDPLHFRHGFRSLYFRILCLLPPVGCQRPLGPMHRRMLYSPSPVLCFPHSLCLYDFFCYPILHSW